MSDQEPKLDRGGLADDDKSEWIRWADEKITSLQVALNLESVARLAAESAREAARREVRLLNEKLSAYAKVIEDRKVSAYYPPGSWVFTGENFQIKALVLMVMIGTGERLYKLGYWDKATWCWVEVPESQVSAEQPLQHPKQIGFNDQTTIKRIQDYVPTKVKKEADGDD